MKYWTIVVCVAALTGCTGPRISVTDVSARRVDFLVQNAWLVPMQEVDEQAAHHCRRHGLSYRRTDSVWISPTSKRVAYECIWMEPPPRRMPAHASRSAAKPAAEAPKMTAWTKARAAANTWALCLRLDAEREAKVMGEAPSSVAQTVVDACSGLEQAVHGLLKAAGEDSRQFQQDLHAQAVQTAVDTVINVRTKAGTPASNSSVPHIPPNG